MPDWPSVRRLWSDPALAIAFGFGTGLLPKAPGTWGTLAAVPLVWWLDGLQPLWYWAVCAAGLVLGIWASGRACRMLQVHDHPGIVIDEVLGYLLTMALVDATLFNLILGFFLFRVLDITKPWPINRLDEKVGGGAGVMLDDAAAGVVGALSLYAVAQLWK